MNFAKLKPTYVSLRIANLADGTFNDAFDPATSPESFQEAAISQVYNQPIFEDASKYVVAVERLELSLNGVPFYLTDGETIHVVERANPLNFSVRTLPDSAYSISQLLTILNKYLYVDPIDASTFNAVFTITKDGFISMTLLGGKQFDDIYFEFPRKLSFILGISSSDQISGTIAVSQVSRLDLGDNLQHIILQTNLQTISDAIGNVPLQVLTDFAPPSTYSNSLTYANSGALEKSGFVTNIRQKVIYNPSERRYLDLISNFAIQNIDIKAYYTDMDGNYRIIMLPLGGCFDIKLGFYQKQ